MILLQWHVAIARALGTESDISVDYNYNHSKEEQKKKKRLNNFSLSESLKHDDSVL